MKDKIIHKKSTEPYYDEAGVKKSIIDAETPDEKLRKERLAAEMSQDLDVPGAELDDAQEVVGSEDEENNYYSIGGDRHNDLDENNNN